ncbi:MAG: RimK-like ATPgrasp N-terminal domain-containing protein, partial [Giesbergeria sp.]|nr:RimK-like ATPgrasp N-terminal domain-containing protein [Giesbergeria sp.]
MTIASSPGLRAILVVDQVADWAGMELPLPLIAAREYLRDPAWQQQRGLRVVNLCRSWRYQSTGYYVSLLAVSRRHIDAHLSRSRVAASLQLPGQRTPVAP